ncbi:hypothetical protein Tco_1104776 [Tanacetum coccineum]
MAGGDIENLTMEQYLALTRGNQTSGVVKPEIGGNVNLEIKSQLMREFKEDTFFENKNDDDHEHVELVLDIVSLFNIPGVTHDTVMQCVFPIILTGAAKRYCPPSKTAKQLEDIHNFKQEGNETLYQAWERYNDLLYKCPTHNINSHQKVNIFYNGLGTMNCQLLDSQGPISGMTPAQALMGAHLYKECPLSKEVQSIEEVIYGEIHVEQDEWLKRFYQSTKTNREAHNKIIQGLKTKVRALTNEVEGRINGGKFKECKAIFTKDGSPLYTPFYYSLRKLNTFLLTQNFLIMKDKKPTNQEWKKL